MKFNYNGVCKKCGAGTSGDGESNFQSNYELCFGCGASKWFLPKKDKEGNVIFSNGRPVMVKGEEKAFGTCLTKDYRLITFTETPSKDRIEELKKYSISLVIWNEKRNWLDVIVGNPLMRKDVVCLERNYTVREYINEPEYPIKEDDVTVIVNDIDMPC